MAGLGFKAAAQAEGEHALLAGVVVAIYNHHVIACEAGEEIADGLLVEIFRRLVHLVYVGACRHIVACN